MYASTPCRPCPITAVLDLTNATRRDDPHPYRRSAINLGILPSTSAPSVLRPKQPSPRGRLHELGVWRSAQPTPCSRPGTTADLPTPSTPRVTLARACASPRLSPSTTQAASAPEGTSARAPNRRRVRPAPGRKGGYAVEPAVGGAEASSVRRRAGIWLKRVKAALSARCGGRTA